MSVAREEVPWRRRGTSHARAARRSRADSPPLFLRPPRDVKLPPCTGGSSRAPTSPPAPALFAVAGPPLRSSPAPSARPSCSPSRPATASRRPQVPSLDHLPRPQGLLARGRQRAVRPDHRPPRRSLSSRGRARVHGGWWRGASVLPGARLDRAERVHPRLPSESQRGVLRVNRMLVLQVAGSSSRRLDTCRTLAPDRLVRALRVAIAALALSCDGQTTGVHAGGNCVSTGGRCLLGPSFPDCVKQASDSAQDCNTNPPNPGGGFCCLEMSDGGTAEASDDASAGNDQSSSFDSSDGSNEGGSGGEGGIGADCTTVPCTPPAVCCPALDLCTAATAGDCPSPGVVACTKQSDCTGGKVCCVTYQFAPVSSGPSGSWCRDACSFNSTPDAGGGAGPDEGYACNIRDPDGGVGDCPGPARRWNGCFPVSNTPASLGLCMPRVSDGG